MTTSSNKPDPKIEQAARRLGQIELSPLEETMFQAWTKANQIDDPDSPDLPLDFRQIYRDTGGKVHPPGQLKNQAQRQVDIQSLMKAQQAHDEASPIKMMMEMHNGGGNPDLGGGSQGGGDPGSGGSY